MSNQYKYTIIIPHYNIPDLLVRCIKSIPQREDCQVVVVDDNSPNMSCDVGRIPELNLPNVELYKTPYNGGGGLARNIGLKYAKGEKILFADADDFFVDDFSEILDEYKEDDSDLIFFNTESVFSEDVKQHSNRTKRFLFDQYLKNGDINIIKQGYTEPWGKIYKSEIIRSNNIKFDETPVANDVMFSLQTAFCSKKVKVVDRPIYVVTTRLNSVSYLGIDTIEKLQTRLLVTARAQLFLEKQGITQKPMKVFDYMVNLSHRNFLLFIKNLFKLQIMGISTIRLLYQIFIFRILAPEKRKRVSITKSSYHK